MPSTVLHGREEVVQEQSRWVKVAPMDSIPVLSALDPTGKTLPIEMASRSYNFTGPSGVRGSRYSINSSSLFIEQSQNYPSFFLLCPLRCPLSHALSVSGFLGSSSHSGNGTLALCPLVTLFHGQSLARWCHVVHQSHEAAQGVFGHEKRIHKHVRQAWKLKFMS